MLNCQYYVVKTAKVLLCSVSYGRRNCQHIFKGITPTIFLEGMRTVIENLSQDILCPPKRKLWVLILQNTSDTHYNSSNYLLGWQLVALTVNSRYNPDLSFSCFIFQFILIHRCVYFGGGGCTGIRIKVTGKFLCSPNFCYCILKSLQLNPILSQFQSTSPYPVFLNIHFNIMLPSIHMSPKWDSFFKFLD